MVPTISTQGRQRQVDFRSSLSHIVRPGLKKRKQKRGWDVAHLLKHSCSKQEALSPTHSTSKTGETARVYNPRIIELEAG